MNFQWPGLLLLLALLPILVLAYVWAQRRARPRAIRYSSLDLIREAAPSTSRLRRHLPFALFLAAIGALVLAMARPVVVVAVPTNQTTIILTIDVSGSMCSSDIPPTRLQAAEAAASQFIKSQAASTQIGLVAFSTYAQVVQAPTTNQDELLTALDSLATGRRTAIGEGILASIDAISEVDPLVPRSVSEANPGPAPAPVPKGDYAPDIVVLLTDGASNTGTPPLDAAQQAADRGVRVYTIGFGTANGGSLNPTCAQQFIGREPGAGGFGGGGFGGGGFGGGGFGGGGANNFRRGIDEATLQQIAQMTGGKYYPAESAGELDNVFSSLPTNLIFKHQAAEVSVVFVGFGVLLSGLGLLFGRLWRPLP
jgi:Ca-activated chloride channel family protein